MVNHYIVGRGKGAAASLSLSMSLAHLGHDRFLRAGQIFRPNKKP